MTSAQHTLPSKRIAAVTMVRNDAMFLSLWLNYYARELGPENLYVLFDGEDQEFPDFPGAHFEKFPHENLEVAAGDKHRINLINAKARELFRTYDIVIGGDVDEFLAVEPETGLSLARYLSERAARSTKASLSGLGLDVGQNMALEAEYSPAAPVLSQRRYALLSTRYTKPVVLLKRAEWGSGFHRVKGRNFHIDPNLYLIHLGCFDYAYMMRKTTDKERLDEGWERHFHKRTRTIRCVTENRAKEGTCPLRTARFLQSVFRPPYAWNKPAMLGLRWVVTLPERFKNII